MRNKFTIFWKMVKRPATDASKIGTICFGFFSSRCFLDSFLLFRTFWFLRAGIGICICLILKGLGAPLRFPSWPFAIAIICEKFGSRIHVETVVTLKWIVIGAGPSVASAW